MGLATQLFVGFRPDEVFQKLLGWLVGGKAPLSVDMSELIIVFGTIAISLGFMVIVGNWWQR